MVGKCPCSIVRSSKAGGFSMTMATVVYPQMAAVLQESSLSTGWGLQK